MRDDGCIGWIAGAVGWIFLWGMCMRIGDIYKISPFAILFYILLITVIVTALVFYLRAIYRNRNYKKHSERVDEIQQKYELAYRDFVDKNHIKREFSTGKVYELSELEKISCREDDLWEQEEKKLRKEKEERDKKIKLEREEREKRAKLILKKAERIKDEFPAGYEEWAKTEPQKWLYKCITEFAICDAEEKIKALNRHIMSERWERRQSEFASKCYDLSNSFLPHYGRYSNNIPFTKYDSEGNMVQGIYKVWQFSPNSICLEGLDCILEPSIKDVESTVSELKNKTRYYQFGIYLEIAKFIKEIAAFYYKEGKEAISVLFNYDKAWDEDVLNFHYDPLLSLLSSNEYYRGISCDSTRLLDNYEELNDEDRVLLTYKHIVIFDIVADSNEIKRLCERITKYDNDAQPVIIYISLLKVFDKQEKIALIVKEVARQNHIKEERKKEEKAKQILVERVSSWDTLAGGLHYSYLFYYYPTTCEFEATEEEWANRRILWNFKNTPGKISASDHQDSLEKVIPMLKKKLLSTFEEDSLKYLTLVCVPASSQIKTQARYEDFSNRICSELGMINAYPYITVVSEKEEKHLGGTGMNTNQLSFDEDFFKGKYVLLFDDVITKGDSMRKFKEKMEELGATVIGGLSLGKTKHERPVQGSIPQPYSRPVFSAQQSVITNLSDLPF